MTAGLFAGDGCVQPNLATREYKITLEPECNHGVIRGAEIIVRAESAADAERYANDWVRHGVMRRTVVTGVGEA